MALSKVLSFRQDESKTCVTKCDHEENLLKLGTHDSALYVYIAMYCYQVFLAPRALSTAKAFSTGSIESTLPSITFDCFPSSQTIPSYIGGSSGAAPDDRERRLPNVYANHNSPARTRTPTTAPTPTPALKPTLKPLGDPIVPAGPVYSGTCTVAKTVYSGTTCVSKLPVKTALGFAVDVYSSV